jgi:hypothetical protein
MEKMNVTPDFRFDEFKHLGVDFDSPEEVAQFDRKQGTTVERDNALLDRLGVGAEHVKRGKPVKRVRMTSEPLTRQYIT